MDVDATRCTLAMMLFGDSHAAFFRFPLMIGVNDPVSITNAYW
jgi:hypothetical protein